MTTPAGSCGPLAVAAVPAAPSDVALEHFAALLSLETDCWDVHDALANGPVDFVLLDVRSPELFAAGHVPGAVNLPHRRIVERNLATVPARRRCSSSTAPARTATAPTRPPCAWPRSDRPVKKMIGGIEGWKDEGFDLEVGQG